MELQLSNQLQHHIADLMWKAKDKSQIKKIISIYGKDAVTVLHMMMASYLDEVDATDLAQDVIARVK